MPKIATKLFGLKTVAASTGFAGFIVLIVPFIKVLNIAKDTLKAAILRFKRKSKEETIELKELHKPELEVKQESY